MTVSDYLSELSGDELADELEARGYVVFNDTIHLAGELSDDEIEHEYENRSLGRWPCVEDAIDFVQDRGYHVYRTNEIEDIWHDIYSHALTLDRDRFMMWLNGEFIKNIERWV